MNRRWLSLLPLASLFMATLLLYLGFQSISFDDFDSVSFALALDQFNIALQQPHPPGFPIYVAMGRLVYAFAGDRLTALTLISAICGAVSVTALAWLGAASGHRRAGLLAALWLMVLPIFWLSSEMALSDVPGLALVLLAVVCLWKGWQGHSASRWLVIGAALAGLCLGLRPQNSIPVALFGVYACVRLLRRSKTEYVRSLGVIGAALLVGLISVLVWLVPTVNASGGWDTYWSLVRAHSSHLVQIDSLFRRPVDGAALAARVDTWGRGFLALFGDPVIGVITLVILAIGLILAQWGSRQSQQSQRSILTRLCVAWIILVGVQVFLFESLERPRLYLPFIPPLLLLAATGWAQTRVNKGLKPLVPLSITLLLAAASLPLAVTLSREPTPPTQAAQYIAAHYPANQSLVVTMGSLRAAQIGLPAYPQLYLGQFDTAVWTKTVTDRQPTYLILLDRDEIWSEAYAALTEGGRYVPVDDRVFSRDPRVFPQHSLIRLQVLTPLHLLSPAQLALPSSGTILVADTANSKYLGEGWYRAEVIAGSQARWTQQVAVLRAAIPSADTALTIEAAPYPADQSINVIVNGQSIGTLPLRDIWKPVTVPIPATALIGYPISTITLRHARTETPLGSSRPLAAAYRLLRFSSQSVK